MALEIESWEDRSGRSTPTADSFGFVYFNDGSRVGYSPSTEGHDDVWQPQTNGGGRYAEVTQEHLDMARELLREKGILS